MKLNLQLADLDDDGLDLTSLIDVIFLLLTFFILAATFVAPALEVELAKAKNLSSSQGEEHTLTFSINELGNLYYEQNQISQDELRRILGEHSPEVPIIFNVDQAAPFESFMTVLDEAKGLDRRKFLINGQPKAATSAAPQTPTAPSAATPSAPAETAPAP